MPMGDVNNNLCIRGVLPMMQPQEQVDNTDAVIRAHQLKFLVLGQIAQMDGAEFSEHRGGGCSRGPGEPHGRRMLAITDFLVTKHRRQSNTLACSLVWLAPPG